MTSVSRLDLRRNPPSPASSPVVLVTGGAGYIGSHIVLGMVDCGWRVIVVDDLSSGVRPITPPGAELHVMDCADPAVGDLVRDHGVSACVHMAGRISTDESVRDPLGYYATNLCVSQRLFATLARAGLQAIVFSSTAAVYGETSGRPVAESRTCRPVNPYGRSKLATEWLLRDVSAASSLRHVIFRYFNVAGADPSARAGPRDGAQHLLKRACEAAVGLRRELTINGDDYDTADGTCIRDYIHVSDLAQAHILAVEHLLRGGASFTANCGYGRGFSVREVIETARALADRPFDVRIGPRRPGDPTAVVADARRLARQLAWRPQYAGLEVMIASGMTWERTKIGAAAAAASDGHA